MFSPYYARARRRAPDGAAEPLEHCAINVALYGPACGEGKWAMTERGRSMVSRDATSLRVGPSAMRWDGDALVIDIDEWTVPLPTRLRGTVRLHPLALVERSFALDDAGVHRWRPIAPSAHVEVSLSRPALSWRGTGYMDSNGGGRPLEADFARWDWSRAALGSGRSAVLYDVERRTGEPMSLALQFDRAGGVEAFEPPPRAGLPRTAWGLERGTRCDAASTPSVLERLEDAPFYARSLIEAQVRGERATAVHESLSLDRFSTAWCQWMLPFRMPRVGAR